MTNPLKEELREDKKADGNNGQQSNNGDGTNDGDKGQPNIIKPVVADQQKLLEPFLQSGAVTASTERKSAISKPERKAPDVPSGFPDIRIVDDRQPNATALPQDKPKVDFATSSDQQLELIHEGLSPQQIQSMSLNQARAVLKEIREDLKDRGYDPRDRLLGYGTEPNNPNNPFVNPDNLYRPDSRNVDLLDLRRRVEERRLPSRDKPSFDNPFDLTRQFNLDRQGKPENPLRDFLEPERLQPRTPEQEKLKMEGFLLALSTPEQQKQNAQWERIEHERLWDQSMRRPSSLEVRLKAPELELTLPQQEIYGRQKELQQVLRTGDSVAQHIDQLQAEYDRNHWHGDSRWYGVDDKKFLADVRTGSLSNVSDYDKFRALATIDHIRADNPDAFAKAWDTLTPEEKLKPEYQTRVETEKQEHDIRTALTDRLRHEVTKLEVGLFNQQLRQGIVSNAAEGLIGHLGTPGGWGGMFMDSDATSQATEANLDKARQATQQLLALSEFKGNNFEFAQTYQERTKRLGETLFQTSENLTKLVDAHQGRIEGVSDLASITAALSTTLGCMAAAPETFGGSLAAIPILAPMAAGATGKVVTKMLESGTSVNGEAYTLPNITQDAAIAAITSAPFMPGNRIAKPLLQAEATVAKQAVVAESRQLALRAAETSLIQRTTQAGKSFVVKLSEMTPKQALEVTAKQATHTAKQGVGYATAGGIDGAIIGTSRAVIKGEDPVSAAKEGFTGGAIMGPVMGPAIKFVGGQLKKIGRDLKTPVARPDNTRVDTGHETPVGQHENKGASTLSVHADTSAPAKLLEDRAMPRLSGSNYDLEHGPPKSPSATRISDKCLPVPPDPKDSPIRYMRPMSPDEEPSVRITSGEKPAGSSSEDAHPDSNSSGINLRNELPKIHERQDDMISDRQEFRRELADLEEGSSFNQWWNRRRITELKTQIDNCATQYKDLARQTDQLYTSGVANIKPGETAMIGVEGEIPIFDVYHRSHHAQIKSLGNGTYELLDGIAGKPSYFEGITLPDANYNFGRNAKPSEYGTFVKRVNSDGVVHYENVSSRTPTIVKAGDEVHLGFHPELDTGLINPYAGKFKLIIPEAKRPQN